jgi:hypothetical protein
LLLMTWSRLRAASSPCVLPCEVEPVSQLHLAPGLIIFWKGAALSLSQAA